MSDCTTCAEYDSDKGYCPKYCEVIRKTLDERTRWIPVSERLPEEGWCLCTVHGVFYDYCEILLYQKRKRKMRFFRLDDDGEYVDFTDLVTAWMPLPTPWRGEEDETD